MSRKPFPSRSVQLGAALLRRFVEREPGAIARVESAVVRAVRRHGYIPFQEHRDIVQQSMLGVWKVASGPAGGFIDDLKSVAASIAHARCVDWVRQQRTNKREPDELFPPAPPSVASPIDILLSAEREAIMKRALERMTPDCQELIRLHAGEALTYEQIAVRIGGTEGSLRVKMHHCIRKLRAIVKNLCCARTPGTDGPSMTV